MPGNTLSDCLHQAARRLGLERRDPAADRADRAIEQVVARAIPRIRGARGYRARLRKPVARTLAYIDALIGELGEPVRLDRTSWLGDPYIPFIFTTVELAREFFTQCRKIRDVFAEPDTRACHFLMVMRKRESRFIGYRLSGEIPRKDELQCSVTFEDHRVLAAATSRDRLREELALLALDHLARLIPERLQRDASSRTALRHTQVLLKAQLDVLLRQQREERQGSTTYSALQEKIAGVQDELSANARELTGIAAGPDSDAEYLQRIQAIFLHPEEHVCMEATSMLVDAFGIKVEEQESVQARRIDFFELVEEDGRRLAILCACAGRETAQWAWPDLCARTGPDPS